VQYGKEEVLPKVIRKKLSFAVAAGERVPAYLLLPREPKDGKLPAVLCLHQTNGALGGKSPAGLGGNPNLFYGLHLAELGYVTLAPDYPSFGEYPYDFKKSPFKSAA